MKVYNSSKNSIILKDAKVAENFFTRSVGLLSKKSLNEGEGLIIKPCCSIHTFFMRFNIDVLFINKKNEVIALYENVAPWRILPIHPTSHYVIELFANSITEKSIEKGDAVTLAP